MFTGIVEEMGVVTAVAPGRAAFRWGSVVRGMALGESVAVSGCCLTVALIEEDAWWAELSEETLERTTLGGLGVGDRVNLERPVGIGDRLGGHIVQGHVDGTGEVISPGPSLRVRVGGLCRYIVDKGSVAVDGVSLTAFGLDDDSFSAALIPHTSASTTLGGLRVRDRVNVEVDMLAKYVEKLVAPLAGRAGGDS